MSKRRDRHRFSATGGATGDFTASVSAAAQTALARHHTYALLSQLYLQGPTPSLLPYVQAIPELAQALPPALAPDAAAAEHYHLFGLSLFPYASAFVSEGGLLGGSITGAVAASYAEAGFKAELSSTAADHIGCQLAFLAFLNMREFMEWSVPTTDAAHDIRKRQLDFLHNHVLDWMAPFAVALQRQEQRFFATLGDLTLVFISAHLADLTSEDECASKVDLPVYFQLDAHREDEAPSLQMLAAYLTTPYKSGFSLTRNDISWLARHIRQPRGFGGRRQMLLALMESTQRYGRLEELFTLLDSEAIAWHESYNEFTIEHPNIGPYVKNWAGKLGATRLYLARFRAQL